MSYRVYIDNTLQPSEELNWESVTTGLKRYEDFNALFFEYATGLEFSGATYDYMRTKYLANICDEVLIRVMERCNDVSGQYETSFEGTIFLSEAEWDLHKCIMSCEAEDNSYSSRLVNLKDKEIPLDGTVSHNGTTITPPTLYSVGILHPTTGVSVPRNMYKCIEVFQYLMDYITDGNAQVNSNLFATDPSVHSKTVTFTTPAQLATGVGNIVITFYTPFAQTIAYTVPIQGSAAATLNYILGTICPGTGTQAEYYTNSWRQYPNNATTNGTNTLTIEWFATYRIISITGATTTISDSPPVVGAQHLMLGSGVALRGITAGAVPSISFQKIWEELNKNYNLGFSLVNVSGVATMQIEQISEFFTSTDSTVEVMDVPNIVEKRSLRFSYDSIKVGDGGQKTGELSPLNAKDTWSAVSGTCASSQSVNAKNDWVVDHDRIFLQRTASASNTTNDDDIFLLECRYTAGYFNRSYIERTYSDFVGTTATVNVYNPQLSNYYKVINWLFSSVGDMRGPGYYTSPPYLRLLNTTVPRFVSEYQMKAPMRLSDFKTIKNDASNFITFSPTTLPQDGGIGWIEQIEQDRKTSETTITLIST